MGFRQSQKKKYGDGIIDIVDTVDNTLKDYEVAWIKFRRGNLVTLSKGDSVSIMVRKVLEKAGSSEIVHLRFHGHGYPGCQGIAMGNQRSSNLYDCISFQNLNVVSPMLQLFKDKFGVGAKVDLMGCNVGEGPEGKQLLNGLAQIWRVPVTAGIEIQFAGTPKASLKSYSENAVLTHEGPTVTAQP